MVAVLSLLIACLAGCAHPVVITPNVGKISLEAGQSNKIKANVGLFIPPEVMRLEVTTPGGGGDSVRYFPYRDMDSAYLHILINVFDGVTRLNASADSNELLRRGIKYIITPDLITNSGSTGLFTWPPTNFTVDLTTNIRDVSGKIVGSPRVVGNGHVAGFSDFNGDFGLAGRLAMEDALTKMQRALRETRYNGDAPVGAAQNVTVRPSADQVSDKLLKLKESFENGLITKDDYDKKRKETVDSM